MNNYNLSKGHTMTINSHGITDSSFTAANAQCWSDALTQYAVQAEFSLMGIWLISSLYRVFGACTIYFQAHPTGQ
jgi:hypothetical protein